MTLNEIKDFYETKMYGVWRSGETVTYRTYDIPKKDPSEAKPNPMNPFGDPTANLPEGCTVRKLELSITSKEGRSSSFACDFFLPKQEDRFLKDGKCPILVCMHPIFGRDYILSQGYALVYLNPGSIASDDIKHNGAFYEVYPYSEDPASQTGVLMAWGWGASKVLDALEAGLAEEFGIDKEGTLVTGVSRFGKATAVCGAFEKRFRMVIPACSGAGGLALYNVFSEGKTFDLTGVGGPKDYTYSKNEPLSCLQSDAERGWFNDAFLEYKTPDSIPIDQENLPILAMSKDRYYFVIGACMSEDWVNAPSMWECFTRALKVYKENGLSDRLVCNFHKEGHAVLEEDLKKIIPYFNHMYYGLGDKIDIEGMQTSVYGHRN